jgi:hypothetical protein
MVGAGRHKKEAEIPPLFIFSSRKIVVLLEYLLKAGHLSACRGGARNFTLRGFSDLAVACITSSKSNVLSTHFRRTAWVF